MKININTVYCFLFLICFSCVSNSKKIYKNIFISNSILDTSEISFKPVNDFEINTLMKRISKKIHIDSCIVIRGKNDKNQVNSMLTREIYSKDLYFEGYYYKSNKVDIWKAFYKNKLVSEIMYVVVKDSVNTPVYNKRYNLKGKLTRYLTYNNF